MTEEKHSRLLGVITKVRHIISDNKYKIPISWLEEQIEYLKTLSSIEMMYLDLYVESSDYINMFIRDNFEFGEKTITYGNRWYNLIMMINLMVFELCMQDMISRYPFCKYDKDADIEEIRKCFLHYYYTMQRIIKNAPKTPKDIVVYRGLSTIKSVKGDASGIYRNENGGIISTTFDIDMALEYSDGNYLLRILIPKGFSCLFLGMMQSEIILPNNILFKIIKKFIPYYFVLIDNYVKVGEIKLIEELNDIEEEKLEQTYNEIDYSLKEKNLSVLVPVILDNNFMAVLYSPDIDLSETKYLSISAPETPELESLVSQCRNLEKLIIHQTYTFIQSLLNNNKNIITLIIKKTKLPTIDFSSLVNLNYIWFRENEISYINLSNLPKLENVSLADDNRTERITIDNLPKLEIIRLIDNNRVERIDINNLPSLKEIRISSQYFPRIYMSKVPSYFKFHIGVLNSINYGEVRKYFKQIAPDIDIIFGIL